MLDYYHETGDPDVLEIAVKVGKNLVYLLEHKILNQPHGVNTSAREAGWALFALSALYLETKDALWMDYSNQIVNCFYEWEKEMGTLMAAYTEHSMIRTPFMISVAINALKSFYNICPSEKLKALLLSAADDMADNCISKYTGLFIYKEFPSVNQSMTVATVLGALTYAYQMSGDVKYLKYGLATFETTLRTLPTMQGDIRTGHHLMIKWNGSPSNKAFAENGPNLMLYYKAVMDNGLMP